MAAKPRVTVRLAPANLHALAYLAERAGFEPAIVAREMLSAQIVASLTSRGWLTDWQQCWSAWQAEQGSKPDRFEAPEQSDYDALAEGRAFPSSPAMAHVTRPAAPTARPLSVTIEEGEAAIKRVVARLQAAKVGQ